MSTKVKWKLRRTYYGWAGDIDLPKFGAGSPFAFKQVKATGHGRTKAEALKQAETMLSKLTGNPIVQAALPPGTGKAVQAIGRIADAAAGGDAAGALKGLAGKGAKRLAKALKFW